MDGNNAAAYVSYAFTEVAGICPITPSSPMADYVDQWSAKNCKNMRYNRQGCQIPGWRSWCCSRFSLSFERSFSCYFSRPLAHASKHVQDCRRGNSWCLRQRTYRCNPCTEHLSDHSDVMSARRTGFALLAEGNVQEGYGSQLCCSS